MLHGEALTLEVDSASMAARRELSAVAWSVLEALALTGSDAGGTWVATTSARDLGSRSGIGKDRAAAALGMLRAASLVEAHTSRDASSRFAAGRYEVRLPVSRIDAPPEPVRVSQGPDAGRRRARSGDGSPDEPFDLFSTP